MDSLNCVRLHGLFSLEWRRQRQRMQKTMEHHFQLVLSLRPNAIHCSAAEQTVYSEYKNTFAVFVREGKSLANTNLILISSINKSNNEKVELAITDCFRFCCSSGRFRSESILMQIAVPVSAQWKESTAETPLRQSSVTISVNTEDWQKKIKLSIKSLDIEVQINFN